MVADFRPNEDIASEKEWRLLEQMKSIVMKKQASYYWLRTSWICFVDDSRKWEEAFNYKSWSNISQIKNDLQDIVLLLSEPNWKKQSDSELK